MKKSAIRISAGDHLASGPCDGADTGSMAGLYWRSRLLARATRAPPEPACSDSRQAPLTRGVYAVANPETRVSLLVRGNQALASTGEDEFGRSCVIAFRLESEAWGVPCHEWR